MDEKGIAKKKVIIITVIFMIAGIAGTLSLFYFGILHINNPGINRYPVVGVDVSAYQGDVDWKVLSSQGISFAYIKATEGSSHTDRCFSYNWEKAAECDIRTGAYHFFSFESPGKTQAEHFIETVSPVENMLPPVIDVEYYGRFKTSTDIDVSAVRAELRDMIERLNEAYGMMPVIYVSKETNETIIGDNFDDCDLWIRSVYAKIPKEQRWSFWQFSNRHRLKGYEGEERYIDMNVFCGTPEEFKAYP